MKRGSTPGRDYRRPVTHDTHSQTIDACHSWCSWLDKSSWWDRNRQCNFRLLIVVKRSAKCHCLISPYTLKRIGQFNLFAQGGTVGSRGGPSEAALFGPEGPLFCRGQSGGTAFKGGLSTAWQFYSPHPSHSTLHTPHMHTLDMHTHSLMHTFYTHTHLRFYLVMWRWSMYLSVRLSECSCSSSRTSRHGGSSLVCRSQRRKRCCLRRCVCRFDLACTSNLCWSCHQHSQ